MEKRIDGKAKKHILRDSMLKLLQPDQDGRIKGLNFGFLDFGAETGGVDFPVAPLDDDANKYDLDYKGLRYKPDPVPAFPAHWKVKDVLASILEADYAKNTRGKTAIVDALYESYLYYAGKDMLTNGRWGQKKWKAGGSHGSWKGDWRASHSATYRMGAADQTETKWCAKDKDSQDWWPRKKSCSEVVVTGECKIYKPGDRTRCKRYKNGYPPNYEGDKKCLEYEVNKKKLTECPYEVKKDKVQEYISPIKRACQDSFVVLFSDGKPTKQRWTVKKKIKELIAPGKCTLTNDINDDEVKEHGACGPELVEKMRDPQWAGKMGIPFDKPITTYTIGFDIAKELAGAKYLELLAEKGGGKFYTADNAEQLDEVFRQVLDEINQRNTSFVAPSFTLSRANRLMLDNDIYLTMFEPSSKKGWPGNVKWYRISHEAILDLNGRVAIDPDGHFVDTAQSYWTDGQDGGKVTQGGLAARVGGDRTLYTYTGDDAPGNTDLTASQHRFEEDNTAIDNTLLGLPDSTSDADRENLIRWARGVDVHDEDNDGNTDEQRSNIMGAPLHSSPVVFEYKTGGQSRKVLFTMNNKGFLHAFDVTKKEKDDNGGGNELFAFIPQALLKNLEPLSRDEYGDYIYGLDGHLVGWRKDDDHAYLFFGMRRGGYNYYALDVSDLDKPKLMWRIEGGSGDFASLGQTWSRPSVVRVKANGSLIPALVFGGGYDTAEDSNPVRTANGVGNAVYIVDAMTGKRLWWGGNDSEADLKMALGNAIPSDIRAIDLNGNGRLDRLYFGDTGGRLWRVDLNENDIQAGGSSGILLADINDGTESGNRRFFYPPSVGLMHHGDRQMLAVAIGSGYRAHPINDRVNDRFYLFMDPDAETGGHAISEIAPLDESKLHDATDNAVGEDDDVTVSSALKGKHGWFLKLEHTGEKVLAAPLIFDGRLFFNSYQPKPRIEGGVLDVCKAGDSVGRAYILNLHDATPALDVDKDGTYRKGDRYVELLENTIPPEPKVIFTTELETPQVDGGDTKEGSDKDDGASGNDAAGGEQQDGERSNPECSNFTDFWSGKKRIDGGCTTIFRTYWNEEK